jgi:hypothetical protein
MKIEDAYTVIMGEIEKIPGYVKHKAGGVEIVCPFHDDTSPSLGINTSFEAKVPIGFFNCFARKTKVITRRGTKSIGKLAGGTHKILTDGGVWVDAEFASYGKQKLMALVVSRNGVMKTIYTTANHNWYVAGRKSAVQTVDLKAGAYLETNPVILEKNLRMDFDGVRHGFVFGDGTAVRSHKPDCNDVVYTRAYLIDHKNDFMAPWFAADEKQYKYQDEREDGRRTIVDKLPKHWKDLPSISSGANYIYGFLAGLMAADGSVHEKGTVRLHSSQKKTLQKIRDLATRIGINTLGVTGYMRKGYGEQETALYELVFPRGTFPADILINPVHKKRFLDKKAQHNYMRWRVVSVKATKRKEEVFCCEVPGTHRFTLADNILTGNCWSCPAKGPWNKLAEKLGLQQVKDWQNFDGSSAGEHARFNRKKKEQQNTNNRSINRLYEELGGSAIPWPKEKEWRGYPGTMIERVQGTMFSEDQREDVMLALPIYINGRYRGGVKALMEKQDNGLSYINTKGDWVRDYGLLGYDFIRKHKLFGCQAVVLCEGPRDWLRLVLNKIPACAILGAKMFGERKRILLQGLGITKIYTLTDNDKAGRKMASMIAEICEGHLDFEELTLPTKYDDEGKLIKIDPDSADQKIIDKVKAIVYAYNLPQRKPKKKKKVK